ncbi:MAG: enoyl-CoA hydratase/isomerase family protein [Dehalococcoidia bacterium]|nr:enoyl-CoA hydratase/isomerase family protein [Dehalococcoidia bacterium]
MEFKDIIYTKEEGIATITLNRPQALNALTQRMQQEWLAAIEDAKRDEGVRVLVVTGAGRAFCAGRDMRHEMAPESLMLSQIMEHTGENIHGLALKLANLDKPYIGSINGPAVGGGMDFASMCDIRIASERAKFGMAYVRMGLPPAGGGCYYLPRIVGIAKACELIWTGRIIDAAEAIRIGYVSKVVPHDELEAATKELATQLAKGPSLAIKLAKRLIYRCLDLDLARALEEHRMALLIAQGTEDAKEGPRAFIEKREPIFKGR